MGSNPCSAVVSLCDFKQIEYTPRGSVSLSLTRDVNDYLICLLVCLLKAGTSSRKCFLNVSLTYWDHGLSCWWCVAGQRISIHCCLQWNVIVFIMFACTVLHLVLCLYLHSKPHLIQLIQSLQFVLPLWESFSLVEDLKSRDCGVSCLAIFDSVILYNSANGAEPDFPCLQRGCENTWLPTLE